MKKTKALAPTLPLVGRFETRIAPYIGAQKMEVMQIRSAEDLAVASAARAQAKDKLKKMEFEIYGDGAGGGLIQPLRKVLDNLYARYRAAREPYETLIGLIDREMTTYAERERLAAVRLAEQQAKRGKLSEQETALVKAEAASVVPQADGVSFAKVWTFEIIDESAVPVTAHGLVLRPVAEAMLRKIATVFRTEAKIPGVKFFETLQPRAKKGSEL